MLTRPIAGLLVLSAGCQASAGARAEVQSSGDSKADSQANMNLDKASKVPEPPLARLTTSDLGDPFAATPSAEAMLGARAGLRVNKTGAANCHCLTVVVGQPNDAGFAWEGPVPTINHQTQLIVGLTSEGVACPSATQDSLGASYHGYETSGNDVIVEVETARFGRPIAQGAVVPKPVGDGRVLVRALDAKTPYGRSLDGKLPTCAVWPAK